jgi:hypothetical protein
MVTSPCASRKVALQQAILGQPFKVRHRDGSELPVERRPELEMPDDALAALRPRLTIDVI